MVGVGGFRGLFQSKQVFSQKVKIPSWVLLLCHGGGWSGETLSVVHVSWAPKFLLLSLSLGGWQLQFPCWFQASSLQTVDIAQQTRGLHLSHLCESENSTDIFGHPEVLLVTSIRSRGAA